MEREHGGKKYAVIMGRLKGETTMTEQAYRYPKGTWEADEARKHCSNHHGHFEMASNHEESGGSMLRFKMIRPEIKVLDAEAGTLEAIVSTESKDRDGDVIRQSGWELERFQKHPVLLSSHNYMSLRAIIGKWDSMEVVRKRLIGHATYFVNEGNEEADWAFKIAQRGLAAYSVGFVPDMVEAKEIKDGEQQGFFPSFEFRKQELLEVSQVTVPSNPEALQRMKGVHPVLDDLVEELLSVKMPKAECECCTDCDHCAECKRCEKCGKMPMGDYAKGLHGDTKPSEIRGGEIEAIANLVIVRLESQMAKLGQDLTRTIINRQLTPVEKAPLGERDLQAIIGASLREAVKEIRNAH